MPPILHLPFPFPDQETVRGGGKRQGEEGKDVSPFQDIQNLSVGKAHLSFRREGVEEGGGGERESCVGMYGLTERERGRNGEEEYCCQLSSALSLSLSLSLSRREKREKGKRETNVNLMRKEPLSWGESHASVRRRSLQHDIADSDVIGIRDSHWRESLTVETHKSCIFYCLFLRGEGEGVAF